MFMLTNVTAAPGQAMAAMVQLELPHINVLTKVDLLNEPSKVCACLHPDLSQPSVAWQNARPVGCLHLHADTGLEAV